MGPLSRSARLAAGLIAVALLLVLLAAQTAAAATYTVGTASDTAGTCANPAAGTCSLRQLVTYENGLPAAPSPPDTIFVPSGMYDLSNGQLNLTQSVTIAGAGARTTHIAQQTATPTSRVFAILGNSSTGFTPTVTISGLDMFFGKADSTSTPAFFGGNIVNEGTLTLSEDFVENGTTTSGSGAGISNYGGTLTVTHSLIASNGTSQTNDSGGIQNVGPNPITNSPAKLTVIDSTVADNTSAQGGGIMSWGDSENTTTIVNSTVTGNDGGARNTVGGGLLAADGGSMSVENSIVAGNTVDNPNSATPSNCGAVNSGTITSLGHNIESATDCGFASAGDHEDTDPGFLGGRSDRGGNTNTFALQATSPAVDAIPGGAPGCSGTDQRDIARPQGTGCDIGAYELFQPEEGHQFSEVLASIEAGSTSAAINWGDGTGSSSGMVDGTTGQVTGTHTYDQAGIYHGVINWTNSDHLPQQTPFDVKVTDAPLTATASPVTAVAGKVFAAPVATFTDLNPLATAASYAATINWGDGSPSSAGTVAASAGGFVVNGTHTYAKVGSYTTTISISDAGGSTATTHGSATAGTTPGPVVTGTPPSITGTTAAFTGSANPDGLPTTAFFQYGLDQQYTGAGPLAFTQSTPAQPVGSDFMSHAVSVSVSGLVPNALYHVRLVATNSAGTTFGPDVTFKTRPAAPPGAPGFGKTFNIAPVSGVVLILLHGQLVPLTELQQIPKNTLIDALHGTLSLTTALPGAGGGAHDAAAKGKKPKKAKTQSGTFGGAIFKISQARNGLATLSLVEGAVKGGPSFGTCKAHKAGDPTATAAASKTLQLLHASAKGKFSTRGRYSAATVRGTKWTVADRCDGTLTHDITHSVAVTDFVRHKTIILHAGQSYLAKAHKRK